MSPMRIQPPSIESLRTLLAFVETGSVTAAATRLQVKQPVVSRKLDTFQDARRWGAVLLRRTDNKTELTDAGAAVLPAIREVLRQYDQLLGYLHGDRPAPVRIRIGVGNFAARFYLPRALRELADLFEECEFSSEILRGWRRIRAVADGQLDVAVVSHWPAWIQRILRRRGQPAGLHVSCLGTQPMCIIAGRKTPAGRTLASLPSQQSVPLEMLRDWELVGLDRRSGIRQQLESRFPNPGDLQFVAEGGSWWGIRECVRHGVGVGIIPLALLARENRAGLVVRRLGRPFTVEYHLISRTPPASPLQQRVHAAFKRAAEEHQKELQNL